MRALITFGGYGAGSGAAGQSQARAGAELMALCTAAALASRGHEITLVTDGPPQTAEELAGCPAITTARLTAAGEARLPWSPDVVHAFDLAKPAAIRYGLDLARRCGAPFVLTPSSARQVWPDPALGVEACAAARRVLALSRQEIDDLALPDAAAARLIGQGPSLAPRPDPAAFRRTLLRDGPVVLFLGRRSRLKGLDTLLLAAPIVWRSVPNAVFAIAGPPWDRDDIALPGDHRVADLGVLDLQSKTDAIAGCAVLCLPSRADVFPLVFVEAWTLGRPVVSGDFSGAAAVIRDGVDGLVRPPRPDALAEALIGLLTDTARAERMGAAGAQRAARELTWEVVAASVERCYREVTGA